MIEELIQELRSYPAHYVAAHRAADVLERIDFYNCLLENDLVKLEAAAESMREHIAQQQLDIVTLGQEVGRLREALQNIVYADGDYNLLQAKARAALGEAAGGVQCGADPFENGYDQKLSEKEYRERIKYLMRCHDDSADEIERLRAENERLREALECLVDEQNGPPLLGHERSWCAAMEKARAALGEEK